MNYQINLTRDAYCTLSTTVNVEAESREEAERLARQMSETELDASAFTVTSLDLAGVQGSSQVAP